MSQSAIKRKWESYITALETEVNGCPKRWYGKKKEHIAILSRGEELPPWKAVSIRTHDLRHTFCTMLYDAGVDVKTAMKWMGHADESMEVILSRGNFTHESRRKNIHRHHALNA